MVSDYFHPYLLGGGERRMYEIAKRLAKRHEVHVVTRRLGSAPAYERHEGIHIHRVFIPSRKPALESFVDGLCFMLAAFFKVLRLGDFDWYAPQQFFPLVPIWVASRVKGRPIVATIHDVYGGRWIENYGLRSCPMILFEHISLRLPYSKIVTISKASKGKLVASKVPEWRIEIIPNGVDLAAFNGVKVEKSRKPRVIYVGRLIGYKHIDDLLRAFSGLDLDAELYVVGEGPERKRLEGLVEELGLRERVTFTGFVEEYQKIKMLKSSHVLVLPSTVEGFAMVLIEAMAARTPVVAADIPAVHTSVRDGETGLLFRPRDIGNLKEKLEMMLRSEDLREKLSRNGYNLVEREFTWDGICRKIEQDLRKIGLKTG
jgi:glycosyltransferase involved in cell wall biosynthesis